MTIRLCGYIIHYSSDSPYMPGKSVFSLYPPKKGWRYITSVIKHYHPAPVGTELTPILTDDAIPVYAVECGLFYMIRIHRPKAGTYFFKTYIKLPERVMLLEDEEETNPKPTSLEKGSEPLKAVHP